MQDMKKEELGSGPPLPLPGGLTSGKPTTGEILWTASGQGFSRFLSSQRWESVTAGCAAVRINAHKTRSQQTVTCDTQEAILSSSNSL